MKEQIASLQIVRAIAAIAVVAMHAGTELPDSVKWLTGNIGVDMFFVLSGFIMWTTTTGAKTSGVDFFLRRAVRILPLYWILILVLGLTPHPTDPPFSAETILKSLLFIPQENPIYDVIGGIIPVGWTLELEMLFYVIFALTLSFAWKRRLAVALLILTMLVLSGLVFSPQSPVAKQFTLSIMGEFGLGLILGFCYEKKRIPSSVATGAAAIVMGVGLVILQKYLPDIRLIYYGLPALFFVAAALMVNHTIKGRAWRPLVFLGDASYSIYLIHFLTFTTSDRLTASFEHSSPALALATYTIVAVIFGVICYLTIERPLTDYCRLWLKRLRSGKRITSRGAEPAL
jgi:exopolysaccharide production protein ExoZ